MPKPKFWIPFDDFGSAMRELAEALSLSLGEDDVERLIRRLGDGSYSNGRVLIVQHRGPPDVHIGLETDEYDGVTFDVTCPDPAYQRACWQSTTP
jgi:hypothetical protein